MTNCLKKRQKIFTELCIPWKRVLVYGIIGDFQRRQSLSLAPFDVWYLAALSAVVHVLYNKIVTILH